MTRSTRLYDSAAAAMAAWVVLALLAGCGGESGSSPSGTGTTASGAPATATVASADDARDAGTPATTAGPVHLFVPDLAQDGIATLATLEPGAADVLPAVTLKASAALGANLQVDVVRDELYAIVGHVVEVYAGASSMKPDQAPARSFPLPSTLTAPHALYLDVARDELYVGGDTPHGIGQIVAYPFAHTLRGTPATPSRALFVDHGVAFFTIDPLRERLYVVNADAGVHVFADVDEASGALVATTTVPVLGTGLAIDPTHDRLYVADLFAGLILVDHASSPDPVVSASLGIDDARFVTLDPAADRAYVSAQGSLYVLDHASMLTSASSAGLPASVRTPGALLGAAATR